MKYTMLFPKAVTDRGHTYHPMTHSSDPEQDYEVVYEGEVEAGGNTSDILEFLFQRHNIGDNGDENRPRAREIRSLSVGDVILINDEAWWCNMEGWKQLPTVPSIVEGAYGVGK